MNSRFNEGKHLHSFYNYADNSRIILSWSFCIFKFDLALLAIEDNKWEYFATVINLFSLFSKILLVFYFRILSALFASVSFVFQFDPCYNTMVFPSFYIHYHILAYRKTKENVKLYLTSNCQELNWTTKCLIRKVLACFG